MRKKNRDSYALVEICIDGRVETFSNPLTWWIYITKDNGCLISSMNSVCALPLVLLAVGTSERMGKASVNIVEYSTSTVRDYLIIVACIALIAMITAMSWRRSVQRKRYLYGVAFSE